MQVDSEEDFQSWKDKITQQEINLAIKSLINGSSPEQVLEQFSTRLMNKLLHPYFKEIKEQQNKSFDLEESKQEYFKLLEKRKPPADHIENE